MTPRSLFRALAVLETVTWTLLIFAMILKYIVGVGDWPVSVAGPIHGFAFIAYALAAVVLAVNQRWSIGVAVLTIASAVVPYATIPAERALEKRGLLDGGWVTGRAGDETDARLTHRALRWLLAHPAVFVIGFVAAAAVIMAVLLVMGPPGGES